MINATQSKAITLIVKETENQKMVLGKVHDIKTTKITPHAVEAKLMLDNGSEFEFDCTRETYKDLESRKCEVVVICIDKLKLFDNIDYIYKKISILINSDNIEIKLYIKRDNILTVEFYTKQYNGRSRQNKPNNYICHTMEYPLDKKNIFSTNITDDFALNITCDRTFQTNFYINSLFAKVNAENNAFGVVKDFQFDPITGTITVVDANSRKCRVPYEKLINTYNHHINKDYLEDALRRNIFTSEKYIIRKYPFLKNILEARTKELKKTVDMDHEEAFSAWKSTYNVLGRFLENTGLTEIDTVEVFFTEKDANSYNVRMISTKVNKQGKYAEFTKTIEKKDIDALFYYDSNSKNSSYKAMQILSYMLIILEVAEEEQIVSSVDIIDDARSTDSSKMLLEVTMKTQEGRIPTNMLIRERDINDLLDIPDIDNKKAIKAVIKNDFIEQLKYYLNKIPYTLDELKDVD